MIQAILNFLAAWKMKIITTSNVLLSLNSNEYFLNGEAKCKSKAVPTLF
jgi:hypothetical protein